MNFSPMDIKLSTAKLLQGFSLEILPKDVKRLPNMANWLPQSTKLYIPQLPGSTFEHVVNAAIKVQKVKRSAVPHLAARLVQSENSLRKQLARLQNAKLTDLLLIGGDQSVDKPIFESSLCLLHSGLLEEYGFRHIEIAGHPEGLPFLSKSSSLNILQAKNAYAQTSPINFSIVTQFSLNPETLTKWERTIRNMGITLEIHAGIAGQISAPKLLQFALRCGVGASLQIASKSPKRMLDLARHGSPEQFIKHISQHNLKFADSLISKIHFFPFGSLEQTTRWAIKFIHY